MIADVNEKEFELLLLIKSKDKSLINTKNDFESPEASNYAIEMIRSLLNRNLIHSPAQEPIMRNKSLSDYDFDIRGQLFLTSEALEIVKFEIYTSYKKTRFLEVFKSPKIIVSILVFIASVITLVSKLM